MSAHAHQHGEPGPSMGRVELWRPRRDPARRRRRRLGWAVVVALLGVGLVGGPAAGSPIVLVVCLVSALALAGALARSKAAPAAWEASTPRSWAPVLEPRVAAEPPAEEAAEPAEDAAEPNRAEESALETAAEAVQAATMEPAAIASGGAAAL